VTLNATTGQGYSYVWRRNGTTIGGATAASYVATLAGSYTAVVSAGGCTVTTNSISVTVNPAPTATITPQGPTTFCTGGNVVLAANTGQGFSYVWRRNGTVISGATSANYTATLAGSYTVTITRSGCSTTSSAVTITVNAVPAATITASGPITFCSGGSVTLNANTGQGLTYVWRRNGTTIGGATAASYVATLAGNYTVLVSSGGCSATSNTICVTVKPAPTATIIPQGSTLLCTGGSVVLAANTGQGFSYVWRRNGTVISGATAANYTATLAGSYTVTITMSGCSTTSSAVTITVNAVPAATITASGPTTFCSGGSVTLNATTGQGYSYVWRRNGTTISGATASSYLATLAGNYTVLVSVGGCTATSNSISVTVNPAPTATITPQGSTALCNGGSVVLAANTGQGFSYVWRRNGTLISGATSANYTATLAGSYTVTITKSGCSTTSAAVNVTTGASPTVVCSADPATSTVSVSATGGQAPYQYSWSTVPAQNTATADVGESGTYTVSVTSSNGCSSSCSVYIDLGKPGCEGIRTQTQGGWGATPSGGNPASYMTARFATAFPAPEYLTIGCGNRRLRLTTAQAVTNFLPSTGTPAQLPTGLLVNPTTYNNTLAGQLVALKLSLRFDELDPNFSSSDVQLGEMLIASGTFQGMSVLELVALADQRIGNCVSGVSRSLLNEAITRINEGFEFGQEWDDYLECPGAGKKLSAVLQASWSVVVHPNPASTETWVSIAGILPDHPVMMELLDATGAVVYRQELPQGGEQRWALRVEELATGMYLYRVVQGGHAATGRLVVAH
jgi:hypothetical protein